MPLMVPAKDVARLVCQGIVAHQHAFKLAAELSDKYQQLKARSAITESYSCSIT